MKAKAKVTSFLPVSFKVLVYVFNRNQPLEYFDNL